MQGYLTCQTLEMVDLSAEATLAAGKAIPHAGNSPLLRGIPFRTPLTSNDHMLWGAWGRIGQRPVLRMGDSVIMAGAGSSADPDAGPGVRWEVALSFTAERRAAIAEPPA
jgi:hypothetical protein